MFIDGKFNYLTFFLLLIFLKLESVIEFNFIKSPCILHHFKSLLKDVHFLLVNLSYLIHILQSKPPNCPFLNHIAFLEYQILHVLIPASFYKWKHFYHNPLKLVIKLVINW